MQHAIHYRPITPLWLRASGEADTFMKSLTKMIRSAYVESKTWKDEVHSLLLPYGATPHSNKGLAPADIMLKRKIRGNLPRCQCDVNPNIDKT